MRGLEDARIVGIYTTEQARDLSSRGSFSLALEALNGALDDAGMTKSELDGILSYVTYWPPGRPGGRAGDWAYQLKQDLKWSGSAMPGIGGILEAAHLITGGYLNTVALVCGMARPRDLINAPWTEGYTEFTGWPGAFPVQPVQFSLVAQRYVHEVGPNALRAMGEVGATIRNYGHINPDAVYFNRGPFTAEDVLNSRMIASPLTLLMCSTVNDGGCAMIITNKDRAKDTPKKPIKVITGGEHAHYSSYVEPPVLDGYYEMGAHYRDTLARDGVKHDDINVVAFYDHFSSHVLLQYEEFGFCGKGEAPDMVADGVMTLDGRFPTCTDGGNQSFSHPGFPLLFRPIEGVRQLRGEVKDLCPGWEQGQHTYDASMCRKIPNPRLAFTSNPGSPTLQGAMMVMGPEEA